MKIPVNEKLYAYAVSKGFRPTASDETLEEQVKRVMKTFDLDREDALCMVFDDIRDEIIEFFNQLNQAG